MLQYVKVSGVDFRDGAQKFTASVASATSGGTLELRLDGVDGKLIGTCTVSGTGGWQTWETVSCDITGAEEEHDLYLVFKGESGYLYNIDWWEFSQNSTYETGDINNDKLINIADYCLLLNGIISGFDSQSAEIASDINGDGKVDAVDLVSMRKFLFGITESFD